MNRIGVPDHAAPTTKEPLVAKYRKLIVAVVGLAATLASSGALDGTAEAIVSSIVAIATAAGVYQVKNQPLGMVHTKR